MHTIIKENQYRNIIANKIRKDRFKAALLLLGLATLLFLIGFAFADFSFSTYREENSFIYIPAILLFFSIISIGGVYITKTKYFNHSSIKHYKYLDNVDFKHPVYIEVKYISSGRAGNIKRTYYGTLSIKAGILTVFCARGVNNYDDVDFFRDGTTINFFTYDIGSFIRFKEKIEISDFDTTYTFYSYKSFQEELSDYLNSQGFKTVWH